MEIKEKKLLVYDPTTDVGHIKRDPVEVKDLGSVVTSLISKWEEVEKDGQI